MTAHPHSLARTWGHPVSLLLLCAIGLSACTQTPDRAPKTAMVEGVRYRLFYSDGVLDPVGPVLEVGPDGRHLVSSGAEPFPWISGWVVQRGDGKPVTLDDGDAAKQIFGKSCPSSEDTGRLINNGDDPVWFFGGCGK